MQTYFELDSEEAHVIVIIVAPYVGSFRDITRRHVVSEYSGHGYRKAKHVRRTEE